jgi:hypothetical protein
MTASQPPILGRALLWLALPESDLQTIRGDLDEEFATHALPNGGAAHARSWYMRQVWTSLPHSLSSRCRTAEIPQTVLVAYLGFLVPVATLNALRSYVLSQIPLKADSLRPTEFLVASLALGMFTTFLYGFLIPSARRNVICRTSCLLALASLLPTLLALLVPAFAPQGWYPLRVLILGPAGVLIGATARRNAVRSPAIRGGKKKQFVAPTIVSENNPNARFLDDKVRAVPSTLAD